MDHVLTQYQSLEHIVLENNSEANVERLRQAFDYARAHHGSQMRKSGRAI